MFKKFVKNNILKLQNEIDELKEILNRQSEQIDLLSKTLEAVALVKVDSEERSESYGKIIYDEIAKVKNSLEILVQNKSEEQKNEANDDKEFSLQELKNELLKLVDMMSI